MRPNPALELYRKFIRQEISFEEFTAENNRLLTEALKTEQSQPETPEQKAVKIFADEDDPLNIRKDWL